MKKTLLASATTLALLGVSTSGHAALGDLSALDTFVRYGDGLSYSLPITQRQQGCIGPGCPFYVASAPGQISELIVVATGAGGPGSPVVNNPTNIENAFATPNSNGVNFFTTNAGTAQGINGSVQTPIPTAWDASLQALKTFLAGDEMIFFFNNNNTNSTDGTTQSLAAWALLWITDPSGAVIGKYEFTNNGAAYALIGEGGGGVPGLIPPGVPNPLADPSNFTTLKNPGDSPLAGTNASTDYVLAGGSVCTTAQFVPISCSDPSAAIGPINHNLGANEVAYAIRFPELQAQLNGLFGLAPGVLEDYTFHIDLRLGCDPATVGSNGGDPNSAICAGDATQATLQHGRNVNNGYEQLFIGTATQVTNVPEPGTLALLGGLLAMLALRRRCAN